MNGAHECSTNSACRKNQDKSENGSLNEVSPFCTTLFWHKVSAGFQVGRVDCKDVLRKRLELTPRILLAANEIGLSTAILFLPVPKIHGAV